MFVPILVLACMAFFGCEEQAARPSGTVVAREQDKDAWPLPAPIVDPERRTKPLAPTEEATSLDTSAYVGMPSEYNRLVADYLHAIEDSLGAELPKRKRFYAPDDRNSPGVRGFNWFPDGGRRIFDREIKVPITLLPRPEVIENWSFSPTSRPLGWEPLLQGFDELGDVHGRTLLFKSGTLSEEPFLYPSTPIGSEVVDGLAYHPGLDCNSSYFLPLGKIVAQPFFRSSVNQLDGPDGAKKLRLGEPNGAVLLGEIATRPACLGNSRIRFVRLRVDSEERTFIAYALIDGNGMKRGKRLVETKAGLISPYVRPLECKLHQPRLLQHDLLLMPTPLPWLPESQRTDDHPAHEEWCLDDWFPAQPDACWVIRETELSSPLKECFELMPASQPSDLPVFFIALFAETEPTRLVKELAALHRVSPQPVLDSPEVMQKLEALYQQVTSFPLGQ